MDLEKVNQRLWDMEKKKRLPFFLSTNLKAEYDIGILNMVVRAQNRVHSLEF